MHRVVVVTALLSTSGRAKQRLPGTLDPSDFIVFPESGDRELIPEQRRAVFDRSFARHSCAARVLEDLTRAQISGAENHKL